MPKVVIIVLSYNSAKDLPGCLTSVSKLITHNSELRTILVDNNSSDSSIKVAKKFDNVEIIKNRENLGFSDGNNVGIKKALKDGADFVFLLNPDTKLEKNVISELVKAANLNKDVGILSPKIYFWEGFEFHKDRYSENEKGKVIWYAGGKIDWKNVMAAHRGADEVDIGQYDKITETDFATGAAMFIKGDVFEKINFFDPKYFLYLEDLDFCLRAKRAGFKIIYVPTAVVWHKWAQSTVGGSNLQDYYFTRNRLLFGLKYANWRAKVALGRESLKFLAGDGVKRKAVLDFSLGRFGKRI